MRLRGLAPHPSESGVAKVDLANAAIARPPCIGRARGWGSTVAAAVVQAYLFPGEAWSETWTDEPWSETGAAIGPALR
jgi:hypothetical protein